MSNEEMETIAEKIKNKTASVDEIASFTKAFSELMLDVKNGLDK
jgi:hypothetical protein